MRRIAIVFPLLVLVLACKKQPKEEDPGPPPGPPKVGHSVTKVAGEGEAHTGSAATPSAVEADAGPPDARPVGGNGKPAFRDDQGHVHGPGGPVYMGRGATCDDAHDHCLRAGVWFSVANIISGKLFRAVPIYELEGKWFTWRGDEETPVKAYRTELAGKTPLPAGTQVIFFSADTSSGKWADSEYEAMVSSRWEAAVTESASSSGSVKIAGFGTTPLDTVRLIVETK